MKRIDSLENVESPTIVFRPRRRCSACGLVNVDKARRCRRCGRSFADVDPMAASEMLVRRLRVRRVVSLVVVGFAVLAVFATAYGLHARASLREQYAVRARALAVDAASLERAARSEAEVLVRALDESELRALLREQSGAWAERGRRCAEMRAALDRLVPETTEQTDRQMKLDERLAVIEGAASDLVAIADGGDASTARAAAALVAADGGAER